MRSYIALLALLLILNHSAHADQRNLMVTGSAALVSSVAANAEATANKVEISVQLGHTATINSVAFSPDGRTIVTGSDDNTLKLWDAASGRELQTLKGHIMGVTSVAFSPDGRTIVSGGGDLNGKITLKLWDAASGRELQTLKGHIMGVTSVAFSPDGRTIVSGGEDKTLKLWDVASGHELRTLEGHGSAVKGVAFSPDGRTIVSCSDDNTLKLWDAASGRELRTQKAYNSSFVKAVAFSPDGRSIISGSDGSTLKLWDAASGRELHTLKGHKNFVTSAAFSPDGRTIVSGSDDSTLKLWDAASGRELHTLKGHGQRVEAVAFSKDGRVIVSSSLDKTLKLWDAASGRELQTLKGHSTRINAVAYSSDGRTIVLVSEDNTLNLWDAVSGRGLQTLKGHIDIVNDIAFSPDGRTIVSGSNDKTLKLWDAASGRELQTMKGHNDYVKAVAFSSDGRTIVSGSDDSTLKLWDAASGRELQTLKGHNRAVNAVAFSPDGRTIVSGSLDNTHKLWDAASGRELQTLKGDYITYALAFSPSGRTFVSGGFQVSDLGQKTYFLHLWDAASGRVLQTLQGHADVVTSVVFSPDGRSIVSGSIDNTIKFWDAASGQEVQTLKGHKARIEKVAFSPSGRELISGGGDGTAHLWEVKTGKEIIQFDSFTDGEWIAITPEGYYVSSSIGHQHLNIFMGKKIGGIGQFYDVFYRPDIVQAKLKGEDISSLVTLTIDDVIKSPPPSVVFTTTPQNTNQATTKVCYKATSIGGGIGEVRLFQNGKLVRSDGFYREAVAVARKPDEKMQLAALNSSTIQRDLRNLKVVQNTASFITSGNKGNEFDECQELETLPGENEISVTAFNAPNTIQSAMETVNFKVDRPPEEPHLYVLGVGIDHYSDSSADLQYAAKDAKDFQAMMQEKAAGLYKPQNIHIEGLSDKAANKGGIQNAIQALSAKVKPWDSFIFFVASHGVMLENQYYIVTAGYNGTMNTANFISSNEIIGMSKNIKALSQLYIFDTCHAGGVDNLISGLYDARMSVMAKKMGLHIYASAGSTQTAMDGYQGNGLFTHTLLKSMKDGKATDSNLDSQVSVAELGHRARLETMGISKKLGVPQSPNIINFGRDNALFRVQ